MFKITSHTVTVTILPYGPQGPTFVAENIPVADAMGMRHSYQSAMLQWAQNYSDTEDRRLKQYLSRRHANEQANELPYKAR